MSRTAGLQLAEKRNSHPQPEPEFGDDYIRALAECWPSMAAALETCAVPLRLSESLVRNLLGRWPCKDMTADEFWLRLQQLGLVIQLDETEWRLDRTRRAQLFSQLRDEHAKEVHAAMLELMETGECSAPDKEHTLAQKAYHVTPSSRDEGAALYWAAYCRARILSRFALLPVVAELAESQTRWLEGHLPEIQLYRAAAHYYAGLAKEKQVAQDIFEKIVEADASPEVKLDALFLLGTIKEQSDPDEALRLYEEATTLKDELKLADAAPDEQQHLRLTLARAYFSAASISQARGGAEDLGRAEISFRRGIQILEAVSPASPSYEVGATKRLLEILQKRGDVKEILERIERLGQAEFPVRERFLKEALTEPVDEGYLYYAVSALNHGSGYDQQQVNVEVGPDGSARIEGMYTLMALSVVDYTDAFLEVDPTAGPGAAIRFDSLESLTPQFALRFTPEEQPKARRLVIAIDPPMQPDDRLTFRWSATASPGTFTTKPNEPTEEAACDHVAWEIVAPIKRLEIRTLIPTPHSQTPRAWWELWRVGTWHTAGQARAAYRAFLKDDPARVDWRVATKSRDQLELTLNVNYPCLALAYVVTWEVL